MNTEKKESLSTFDVKVSLLMLNEQLNNMVMRPLLISLLLHTRMLLTRFTAMSNCLDSKKLKAVDS